MIYTTKKGLIPPKCNSSHKRIVQGFTVIEMLLYMGLLTVFMIILVDIFTSTLNLQIQSESVGAIAEDSRFILSRLSYDLENAESVASPNLGQTTTTMQFTNNSSSYSYSVDSNKNLILTVNGISNKLNSLDTKIDFISFQKLGNPGGKPTIQIIFTIESLVKERSGKRAQTIQTTIGLR